MGRKSSSERIQAASTSRSASQKAERTLLELTKRSELRDDQGHVAYLSFRLLIKARHPKMAS